MFPTSEEVKRIKGLYPEGTKVELIQMNDDPMPVPSGTKGSVMFVDDIGQIHVQWDNGSTLALVEHVDRFKVVNQ